MKRGFNEDDEFKDEEDLFPDVGDDNEAELTEEYLQILEKRELIEVLKIQTLQKELNYIVLNRAVKYLEKSWFWKFKSHRTRLNLLVETYQVFKALIDMDYQQQEESNNADLQL